MKFKRLMFLPVLAFVLNSCSGDDSSDSVTEEPGNNFAMTAKINGTQYNMYSPFNTNTATESSFTQYPDATHLHLQGWPVGVPIGDMEITIYISRENLSPGTYEIQTPDNPNAPNQIDLIDNTNDEFENTIDGSLTITSVNTTTRVVTGTFHFMTSADYWAENPAMNYNITEGTFNYRYDTEDID